MATSTAVPLHPPQVEVLIDCTEGVLPPAEAALLPADADWQRWFSLWLGALEVHYSPLGAYELSLQLTDDAAIAALNAAYRQQPKATDVLAFAALENSSPTVAALLESEPLYLGDIIISLETAQRQAIEQGHSLRHETVWLAVHGFLHLLGWDHPDDESLVKMLAKQTELLGKIRSAAEELS